MVTPNYKLQRAVAQRGRTVRAMNGARGLVVSSFASRLRSARGSAGARSVNRVKLKMLSNYKLERP